MNTREQFVQHLKFAGELGVTGISRDSSWRSRAVQAAGQSTASAAAEAAPSTSTVLDQSAIDVDSAAMPSPPIKVVTKDSLEQIKIDIGPDCSRCKLQTLGRSQIVFGVGNPEAKLMFVGEAPGADEDEQGIPFVGRAGQLLTKIIEAIELKRDDVYIANVIKCRPPNNRNPEPDEVASCEPYLFRQVDVIKPQVIVTLGKFATQCLLRTEDPISKLRGRQFNYRGSILIPTFHPAYLLRNPSSKREVWEDMKLVRSLLQG